MASPPAAAEEVPMAPGFRFHPTDEELVSYYLRRRVLGRRLRIDAIAEVDLYRLEPWDLPPLSRIRSRDAQWYFFARLDRKVAGAGAGGRGGPGNRTNRATPRGYWKTTGKDREVSHRGRLVGMKKTLVFHAGRAPKGDRTNWVMHEYRLLDNDGPQDMHVVCRIFQKVGSGPQNGAQYGAPYMEEEWEDEDDAIENTPTSGTSTEMLAITDTASAESNVEDENIFSGINELVQIQDVLIPPEIVAPIQAIAPLQAQGLNGTGMGSYADGDVSLDEILQEPVSDVSVDNTGEPEEQSPIDDHFSLADLSGCPNQDDGYVRQAGLTMWSDPSNGDQAYYPIIRTYGNRNHANMALSDAEYFDTENDTNAYFGQQQACPSDDQNLYSGQQQACPSDDQNLYGPSFPQQVGDNEQFYEASSDHKWVDGKDDCANVNDLSIFDDDIMSLLNASEGDFSLDLLGPVDGSNSQFPAASDFDQKDEAKAQYGASSSGSRENLYPDSMVTDLPMDDNVGKRFGKFANMLGSYPAPPAMASEFPPTTGKSIAALSGPSQIRVTAGIVQLGDHSFTGNSDNWPLQKNGVFNLLLSFTVESNVSTKLIGFDDEPATTRVSTVPTVLRGGLYLFFVSAMILMLSFKVGSCIYSR
ncbi:NAC domain-containing protein 78-like isoform X2 [Hordeum vulgare subsp. vulgare]|uniref:Predicted protein n=1 Tax=Hordeum vulgare subsp. vulgare TaxID=112509 RepID=F2DRF2_HORVV|nr:NAC domain-containing protein 78-like isoform X2 [Hordeum vulgare subsp. vulgare]BAJ97673.1 predicted protein [Hordeum vulgare subsp. vulgare]